MTSTFDQFESIAHAQRQWQEGEDRVSFISEESRRREVIEDVIDAIVYELHKRVGQTFQLSDLVDTWRSCEPWCTEIVHERAPDNPGAWELSLVADAAFHRMSRRAQDWGVTS